MDIKQKVTIYTTSEFMGSIQKYEGYFDLTPILSHLQRESL